MGYRWLKCYALLPDWIDYSRVPVIKDEELKDGSCSLRIHKWDVFLCDAKNIGKYFNENARSSWWFFDDVSSSIADEEKESFYNKIGIIDSVELLFYRYLIEEVGLWSTILGSVVIFNFDAFFLWLKSVFSKRRLKDVSLSLILDALYSIKLSGRCYFDDDLSSGIIHITFYSKFFDHPFVRARMFKSSVLVWDVFFDLDRKSCQIGSLPIDNISTAYVDNKWLRDHTYNALVLLYGILCNYVENWETRIHNDWEYYEKHFKIFVKCCGKKNKSVWKKPTDFLFRWLSRPKTLLDSSCSIKLEKVDDIKDKWMLIVDK